MSKKIKSVSAETTTKTTTRYQFSNFEEMIEFLMSGNEHGKKTTRTIEYHEQRVRRGLGHTQKRNGEFVLYSEKNKNGKYVPSFGKKANSCFLEIEIGKDEHGEMNYTEHIMKKFFDKDDHPDNVAFAKEYHMEDFVGVEVYTDTKKENP